MKRASAPRRPAAHHRGRGGGRRSRPVRPLRRGAADSVRAVGQASPRAQCAHPGPDGKGLAGLDRAPRSRGPRTARSRRRGHARQLDALRHVVHVQTARGAGRRRIGCGRGSRAGAAADDRADFGPPRRSAEGAGRPRYRRAPAVRPRAARAERASASRPSRAEKPRESTLRSAVVRVASEQDQIDQELGATAGRDPIAEFAQRSRLFRTRGLSLDTSLVTNYSVERALAAMKARGLLAPGALRRVAIVGPGLDFADKDVGFDFYPQQTLQPFAVLDALERLGLAPSPGGPEIVLLDISPRVVDHVTRARARAASEHRLHAEPAAVHRHAVAARGSRLLAYVRRSDRRARTGASVEGDCGVGRAEGRPGAAVRRSPDVGARHEHRDRTPRRGAVRPRDCHQRVHLLRRARTGAGDVEHRGHAQAGRLPACERLGAEAERR